MQRRGIPERERGVQPQRDPPGKDNKETQGTIVSVHMFDTDRTAADPWYEAQGEGAMRMETWPAPPGSVTDLRRPQSSTSVVEHSWSGHNNGEKERVQACTIRTVGINQDTTVIVYSMTATGVMDGSGANACIADSEVLLVDCHSIRPVTVGLVIAAQKDPTMHTCNHMGYMLFTRQDGGVHRQPFLVNH